MLWFEVNKRSSEMKKCEYCTNWMLWFEVNKRSSEIGRFKRLGVSCYGLRLINGLLKCTCCFAGLCLYGYGLRLINGLLKFVPDYYLRDYSYGLRLINGLLKFFDIVF